MNPQQNQNNQPDYGFIVNQPGVPPPKKGMDFRLKILVSLIILLVIFVPLVLIINRSSELSPKKAESEKYAATTRTYLGLVDAENYQEAYTYFDESLEGDQATYVELFGPVFRQSNNIAGCAVETIENTENVIKVLCTDRENTTRITYRFKFSATTGKIIDVTTVQEEPVANEAA